MSEIHEGKAVQALLAEAGYSQADFSRAYPSPKGGPLSGARASTLLNSTAKFKHATWEKVRVALQRLSLDPNRIRPAQVQARPRAPEDLRPLIDHLKPDQQEIVLRILKADDDAKLLLRVALEERLGRLQ
jgi:hypothetical protein